MPFGKGVQKRKFGSPEEDIYDDAIILEVPFGFVGYLLPSICLCIEMRVEERQIAVGLSGSRERETGALLRICQPSHGMGSNK